ncbi:amidohydrolase [Eubacterium sp.]|uniref:amidohydrolase n=1 Tax=Eubacterium sp. TaxID=142586 RepID=UPI0026DFE820|nr:amidohydrolase [Eubacterium sp.]MDO5433900.1 amidohydrolase [Eubacterium sp.]
MNDLALTCGNIITMDTHRPFCEAVLIENGKITAAGRSEDVRRLAGERHINCVDLKGKTAVPGLHDCHVHVMGTGLNAIGIDLYDCASIADVLDKIRKASEDGASGWVYCTRLDESRLAEKRPPTAAEIDAVVPDRGVCIVDRGLHYTLVNTLAFNEIGFDGTEHGLVKDASGHVTGRLHDKANGKARSYFYEKMTDAQRADMLNHTASEAVKMGITTIHAMEGGDMFSDKDIPVFLENQRHFPLDIRLYWDTENIQNILDHHLPVVGTDLLLDGSIGSRTAAFMQPYTDAPDTCGEIYFTEDFVVNHITNAHKNHLQAGFHAIGQRAVTFVLDCLEKSLALYPCTGHRFRIEHFGFPDVRDIERAAQLGVVISTQPSFTYLRGGPGSVYNLRLGDDRERRGYPLSAFVKAGIPVGGGSDSGVTPMDPVLGLHAAVNQSYSENSVDIQSALRMFTLDAAYCAFEEHQKGSITPGKLGDLTVLSGDPYTTASDKLKDLEVCMTIKNGKIVYQK